MTRWASACTHVFYVVEYVGKRLRRQQRLLSAPPDTQRQLYICFRCGRICTLRIGLYSHTRRCNPRQKPMGAVIHNLSRLTEPTEYEFEFESKRTYFLMTVFLHNMNITKHDITYHDAKCHFKTIILCLTYSSSNVCICLSLMLVFKLNMYLYLLNSLWFFWKYKTQKVRPWRINALWWTLNYVVLHQWCFHEHTYVHV